MLMHAMHPHAHDRLEKSKINYFKKWDGIPLKFHFMSKYKYYYHITALENVDKIKEKGLIPGPDKHIYLFTELNVKNWAFNFDGYIPDLICGHQVFLDKYCLLTIDADGITKKIKYDNVGESMAVFQRRVKQECINPEYIINYENRVLDFEHIEKWSNLFTICVITGYLIHEKDAAELYKTGELPLEIGDEKIYLKNLMQSFQSEQKSINC